MAMKEVTALIPFFSAVAGILGPLARDEITLLLGVQDDIELLRERLERMLAVLPVVERHPESAKDIWRMQLTDVIYDADDIVDECMIEGKKLSRDLRRPFASSSFFSTRTVVNLYRSPFSCFSNNKFRHEIGNRIVRLTSRLNKILGDMAALNLTPGLHDGHSESSSSISRRTSPLVEPDLVGERIEEDTKSLVDLLCKENQQHQRNISVFAILGMPGIGKTTLAQKIFNDEKLQTVFDCVPPIWVYVSKDFSETDLLRAIISRARGEPGDKLDKVDLEPMLHNIVKNKKFFLVLDDVWDARVWIDLLRRSLQSGLSGSRVLVTTRQQAVVRRMDAVYCHQVKGLSNEDGWSLLCKMLFTGDTTEEREFMQQEDLKDTGMRIVEKCSGLPLALKTTAGVLQAKGKRRSEWEKVLESPAWTASELPEGVMGAFYLSYQDLPSHLKQCFVYFSVFPEDAELYHSEFVQLWIAEGFVQARGDRLLEEEAEEYWKELVNRSLLQPIPKFYNMSGCRMHDVLHTLAKHLTGNECFSGDSEKINEIMSSNFPCSVKPRRLYITSGKNEAIPDIVKEQHSLRTLMLRGIENYEEDTTRKLRCLRILDIRSPSIEKLPTSIENLIHMRYLNLSHSLINEIPESIGNLQNLQYLILKKCKNLHNLPNSVTSLCNLRCMDLSRTYIHNMPAGIGGLNHLTELSGFVVSSSNGSKCVEKDRKSEEHQQHHRKSRYCNLEELSSLSQLKSLTVYKLERASTKNEASAVALKTKSRLTRLDLHCTPPRSGTRARVQYEQEAGERITEVFEELCPPPCIETLKIKGYFGLNYPTWMMETPSLFLPYLTQMTLKNCDLCGQLPPLGMLPQIDYLVVSGAPAVENIGPEFLLVRRSRSDVGKARVGHSLSCFPKLTHLAFENMPNWEEWCWLSEEDDQMYVVLPCLNQLVLERCPKLRSLPEGLSRHAAALTVIRIVGARSLTEVKDMKFVEELVLYECPSLERVCNLPALKILWLRGCGKLKEVENVDVLRHLHLRGLEMAFLPQWLLTTAQEVKFNALQKLYITGNSQLLTRCLKDGADWHMIRDIPSVEARALDESAYIYYTKSPYSFTTNMPSDTANNTEGSTSISQGADISCQKNC